LLCSQLARDKCRVSRRALNATHANGPRHTQTADGKPKNIAYILMHMWRSRWGRLQSRVLYALVDGRGEARTREIGAYCWDGSPTPQQLHSQGRAAKSTREDLTAPPWCCETTTLGGISECCSYATPHLLEYQRVNPILEASHPDSGQA